MKKPKDPNNPAPKAPPSEARQAASRANGAKSKGPVTPEGKQRSSQNAVTHGILARSLTLSDGDAQLFQSLHSNYVRRFTPRDQPEHDLIEEAVYAKWQMRQAWMMHARTLKIQILADFPEVNLEWDPIPMLDRQTLALAKSLKESTVLPNLERYARQLAAQSDRAIKLFMQLRDQRLPPAEPIVEPNEPEVMAEHYTTEPDDPPGIGQPNEPEPATLTTDHRPLTTSQALTTSPRGCRRNTAAERRCVTFAVRTSLRLRYSLLRACRPGPEADSGTEPTAHSHRVARRFRVPKSSRLCR